MALLSVFPFFRFNKVLQGGLWSVWFSGLLLIGLSVYFTQLLPSIDYEIRRSSFYDEGFGKIGKPNITIFTASNAFAGSVGAKQSLAVRSWLGLSPHINIVLFGNHPSLQSFAAAFGSRVFVESDIDYTFLGTPFFHSMVARSRAFSSDISVLIDPETILLPDFISTMYYAHELDHDWFLIALSRGVSDFPFHLDELGRHWLRKDGEEVQLQKLQEFLSSSWQWHRCEERMLMAWSNSEVPLHLGVLPPFLYGTGLHNYWVINEVLHSNFRFVFDASLAISNFYLIDLDENESEQCVKESVTPEIQKRIWEYNGNVHLGALYGLLYFHEANFTDIMKLVKCDGHFMFTNKAENIVYSPAHRSLHKLWKEKLLFPRREEKIMDCLAAISSLAWITDCPMKNNMNLSTPFHLPFGLESILPIVSDKNMTIVLTVAGYSYKDMLMSWVCRLRHLLIPNFLVFALDDDMYQFSVLQGLPVLRDTLAPGNISFNDCHFGTNCFQKVTKTKSRLVLQILKLGYNVLLSDVDVYWFKNPIPLLHSFGPAVLPAQSDEFNIEGPINLPRRLNSGFYFARSDNSTIAAIEKVVKHAATSELSEQPSFYDTLCGENGSNRVGDDKCREPETNLTVHFLDRDLFPNGAYQGLWEERNVKTACAKKGCYILHNNWISGRMKKLERQRLNLFTQFFWSLFLLSLSSLQRVKIYSCWKLIRTLISVSAMDPDPKSYPLLSLILSQQRANLNDNKSQSDPDVFRQMPYLTHPQVIESMTNSISDIIHAHSLLKPLGDRPSRAAVEAARSRIAEMESKLAEDLESVRSVQSDGDVNWGEGQKLRRREEAEKEMQLYTAVLRLEEMHEEYGKKLREAEERLAAVYRTAVRKLGLDGGDDGANEEVVEILRKASAGEAVERVELPGRELRFVPEAFGMLHDLVVLNLSNNQLELLPDSIAGLRKLEMLDVSSNLLTSMPDSIGLLLKLKVLDLSGNKLNALPESIAACCSLEELNASFNGLSSLPMNMGYGLSNLRKLSIYLNKLRFLPTSLCELKSLKYLDVHFNALCQLPGGIGRLTNLEVLNASSNFSDLTELPESICNLTNLRELDLSNNQIRFLPDAFYRLENLTKLNLEENPLIIPPLEVTKKGAEAVRGYMAKRWHDITEEEQRKSVLAENKELQAGWLGWSKSWLNDMVSGVSETVSGYLGGSKGFRDPYLDQQL
ncbi:hypothetical protein Nepgr_003404 [Nepenthes gracilis]|uniref:Nucleotide-diphospho-sugar transferase domain-containing protein n=1 Tax=Nepenthes gracilis TaxID=150966 RepID=A0AAD3RZF5_NEPGR|nr:hypothetical protein Nepgr_003404 [Nepenthes gracilis]